MTSSIDVIGMVLAGGRVNELSVLTIPRPKSAMPFGGIYRVIDCVLTNLSVSGISRIGILSQFRPGPLMDHVGSGKYWDLLGIRRGIRFLPPHTGKSASDWYKGTADALYQNIAFIKKYNPSKVLIASGDHIYRMDYTPLFALHQKRGAAVTMAVTRVPYQTAGNYGVVHLNDQSRVVSYVEKPRIPESNLASMTVYLFETDVLIDELEKNARYGKTYQIYEEILPELVHRKPVYAHVFQGFWSYSRSIDDYFKANMSCLGNSPAANLVQWKLCTRYEITGIGDPPPTLIGNKAVIRDSIISPGCIIDGEVYHSILSPNTVVRSGAIIENSIIFSGSIIEKDASLSYTIVDRGVYIGEKARIGVKMSSISCENNEFPELLSTGLTVIGKKSRIPADVRIGRNVIIYPVVGQNDFMSNEVKDGETIKGKMSDF